MGKIIDKIAWIHTKDGKILSTLSKGKVLTTYQEVNERFLVLIMKPLFERLRRS